MPDQILNELNINIRKALKQDAELSQSRDGMDVVLCYIDFVHKKIYYAGANRPCVIISNGVLKEYTADKFPIGGLQREARQNFTLNEIDLHPGDLLYLFSDGYADQFGGPQGKKFMYRHLKEILMDIYPMPMEEQKNKLDKNIVAWKGAIEQVDDILVIGIKL